MGLRPVPPAAPLCNPQSVGKRFSFNFPSGKKWTLSRQDDQRAREFYCNVPQITNPEPQPTPPAVQPPRVCKTGEELRRHCMTAFDPLCCGGAPPSPSPEMPPTSGGNCPVALNFLRNDAGFMDTLKLRVEDAKGKIIVDRLSGQRLLPTTEVRAIENHLISMVFDKWPIERGEQWGQCADDWVMGVKTLVGEALGLSASLPGCPPGQTFYGEFRSFNPRHPSGGIIPPGCYPPAYYDQLLREITDPYYGTFPIR